MSTDKGAGLSMTRPRRLGPAPIVTLVFYYFLLCAAVAGGLPGPEYEYGISPKFVCTPIPPDADPSCFSPPSVPPPAGTSGQDGSTRRSLVSDDAKATILHLRESLVRQKETILDQRETIRELTAKLTLCEGYGGHHGTGHHDNHHTASNPHHGASGYHSNDHHYPHGDHQRKGPSYAKHGNFSPEQTGKMLQTLKERLENLQARNSSSSYSSSLRELLQRKINALEEQLHSYYGDHHDDHHSNGHHDDYDSNGHHKDHHSNGHHDDHHSNNHHDDHHSNNHHDDHHSNNHHKDHHSNNHHNDHHSNNHHDDHHSNNHHDDHHSNGHHKDHRSNGHHEDHHSNGHHNDHHSNGHHNDHHSNGHHKDHHSNGHHDDHHSIGHQTNHHSNSHHGNHHSNRHHVNHRGSGNYDSHHSNYHGNQRHSHHGSHSNRHYDHQYDRHHGKHHGYQGIHHNYHDDNHHHDHYDNHHNDHHNDHYDDHKNDHHHDHHDDHHRDHHDDHHYDHRDDHHGDHRYDHHYDHHNDHLDSHHNDHHDSYHKDHHDDYHHDHHSDHHDNQHKDNHRDDHYAHHTDHNDDHHYNHHDDHHGSGNHPHKLPSLSWGRSLRGTVHSQVETVLSQLHHGNSNHEDQSQLKNPSAFLLDFPMRTNYMYARMKRSLASEVFALTLCLWLKAGAGPGLGTAFSYAVPGQPNELVLLEWDNNPMQLLINDQAVTLPLTMNDGKWHHVCVTWSTHDGVWEVYQDGAIKGSGQNLSPWQPVRAGGTFILGQEQDSLGGDFDSSQSFMGHMSDLQFWSRVLSSSELQDQASCGRSHLTGDVLSWSEESLELHGGLAQLPFDPCH